MRRLTPPHWTKKSKGGGVLTENSSISQFVRGRGWWWCVDRGNTPSISRFERGRGVEGVCWQRTPPSRNLCEGGVGGDASTERTPPPSRVLSEGGGVCWQNLSLSRFERGRGWRWWWWCVNRENTPSISRFERGRGEGCVDKRKTPPSRNLREGGVGGDASTEGTPPPSRVSSEGGGWRGCVDREPLRLAFCAREGWRGWMQHDEERHSLRRVGSASC